MSRVILGSYMVRYPLGGMMSWVLQYLNGLVALGHDVWFVEKAGHEYACYDPSTGTSSDDCTYGARIVRAELEKLGMAERWCFVDYAGRYHGMTQTAIEEAFRTADVFFDMGTHGAWLPEAQDVPCRAWIDGEPGFTQMKMRLRLDAGEPLPSYHHWLTTGRNIPLGTADVPHVGIEWQPIFHPVDTERVSFTPLPDNAAPFTTVMNWQSYDRLRFRGQVYGHKDMEFEKFQSLPQQTAAPLEMAVAKSDDVGARFGKYGWRFACAHEHTLTVERFFEYIRRSAGEFSICKNGFVATRSGWFSDRSAVYLATGRPVVQQDTGFGAHLPCGEGLFAVSTVEEAAAALDAIATDPQRHASAARELACEYLDAKKVLAKTLEQLRVTSGASSS